MPSSAKPRRPRRPRIAAATAGANAARGEHTLALAGITYRLRPSFAAVNAIEEATDRSLIELFRAVNTCSLGYADLGIVAAELIRAGAQDDMTRAVSADKIGELIYEEGTARVFAVLTLVLADAIGGGRTASGEAKAVPTTTGAPATA